MSRHDIFKDVPHHRFLAVYDLLRALHRLHDAALYELAYDERFVKLCGHKLGYAALVHLQLRAYDDNRTRGIVHTLTEKVLTETSCLPLRLSESDLSGRLTSLFTALDLRELSSSESTASWRRRFSLRRITSGA